MWAVDNRGGRACVQAGAVWEISVPSSHFYCKPKTALKKLSSSDVKVAEWCPTLCDPMDYTVHGILQARIQPFLSPGDLPNLGIELSSPAL